MSDFSEVIINPSETIVASLGNNYLQNMLATGSLGRSYTILTDRRVYFKGKFYNRYGARFIRSREERVVDLKDITGTGFEKISPYYMLLISLVSLLIAAVFFCFGLAFRNSRGNSIAFYILGGFGVFFALIWVVAFFTGRKTIFKIEYPGGNIGLDLRFISYNDASLFNRCIRNCKDNLTGQGIPLNPPQENNPQ